MGSLSFLDARERFIPFTTSTILERVLSDPRFSPKEAEQFDLLFKMVDSRFHFEFLDRIEELKKCYEPFDPDPDTWFCRTLTAEQAARDRRTLCDGIRKLLKDGNFSPLSKDQLRQCLELQPHGGLAIRVNLDDYPELEVHYRGVREETRYRRHWRAWFRRLPYRVRILKRAAVLVTSVEKSPDRLNDRRLVSGEPIRERVILKLFKDVVIDDLKMMLPKPKPVMRLFDKLKVGGTVAGGVGTTLWKLLSMLFTATVISPLVLVVVLGGFVGAFFKGIFSFLARKTKYMQTLSSCLYFQNLANNVSALTRLVDAAEAQESKELLLAYFILYIERHRDFTMDELDQRVEQWLLDQFGQPVDFEVEDAVRKLIEKDLMVERDAARPTTVQATGAAQPQGTTPRRVLRVYDLPSALRRLDAWWDEYYQANNLGDAANDRLAEANWPPFPPRDGLQGPHAPQAAAEKTGAPEADHGRGQFM